MNLAMLLYRLADHAGDRRAIIDGDGGRNWLQTRHRVAAVARVLREAGAAPGERVILLARNSALFLETVLACAWCGAIVVPLNWRL